MFQSFRNLTQKEKVINLNAEDFANMTQDNNNAVILDVRTEREYENGHLPHSLHIDMSRRSFVDEIKALEKSKEYYLYCRSGNRSYFAGKKMLKMGFENVYHLAPGIIGWSGEIER